jgi:hypothetical protein
VSFRVVPLCNSVLGSVEEIAARFDVSGEVEVVVPDQGACQVGVTTFDRLGHPVPHGGHLCGLLDSVTTGQVVDPAHLDQQVLRHVTDHAAAGCADEGVVDLDDAPSARVSAWPPPVSAALRGRRSFDARAAISPSGQRVARMHKIVTGRIMLNQ